MPNYGTISPSSSASSPPSLDFISRAKQRGQSALSTLRPWQELIHVQAFSFPLSLGDAYLRIRANAAYFPTNYAIIVLLVVFLSLLFHPLSLLVFVAVIAAWIFIFFLRDQPLVIGRTFEESYILIGLSIFTIVLLLITDSTLNIVGSMVAGIVLVLALALLRRTDDLAVDEEAAVAGGWYAVVRESSSRTSPAS